MKRLGVLVVLFLLFVFGVLAFRWIKHRIEYAISDAVFVRADRMANLSFEVSGKVVRVYKDLGDRVRKGELLAQIDSSDYEITLRVLEANLSALMAQKSALALQLAKASPQLEANLSSSQKTLEELYFKQKALKDQIEELKVQLEQAKRDKERIKRLYEQGLVPAKRYEDAQTYYESLYYKKQALENTLGELRVAIQKAQEGVKVARAELMSLQEIKRKIQSLEAQIEATKAEVERARLNLERTSLRAPFDGVVAKRFVSEGDMVKAGQPAFSLIDEKSFYVEVLLEETKLRGVKVGAPAKVYLDAYPGKVFEGVVEEISPASAATFALVPRDVSAGEFTKVVQRIPIKVRIVKGDTSLLRVGMGGRVEIKRR